MFGLKIVKGSELGLMSSYIVFNGKGDGIAYAIRIWGATFVRPLDY